MLLYNRDKIANTKIVPPITIMIVDGSLTSLVGTESISTFTLSLLYVYYISFDSSNVYYVTMISLFLFSSTRYIMCKILILEGDWYKL